MLYSFNLWSLTTSMLAMLISNIENYEYILLDPHLTSYPSEEVAKFNAASKSNKVDDLMARKFFIVQFLRFKVRVYLLGFVRFYIALHILS